MIETPTPSFYQLPIFPLFIFALILQESENDITDSPLQTATWKDLMFLLVTWAQKGNVLMLTNPSLGYPISREGTILLSL